MYIKRLSKSHSLFFYEFKISTTEGRKLNVRLICPSRDRGVIGFVPGLHPIL